MINWQSIKVAACEWLLLQTMEINLLQVSHAVEDVFPGIKTHARTLADEESL